MYERLKMAIGKNTTKRRFQAGAVEGVDVVHVANDDLFIEMGLAGQFEHPEVTASTIHQRTM